MSFDGANTGCAAVSRSLRCRAHGLTMESYLPQLRRLLAGGSRERAVYDSLVDDVVSVDPRQLFGSCHLRSGAYLIEALYRTLPERRLSGGRSAGGGSGPAPLAYARWLAWRGVRDDVRAGTAHCRQVGHHVARARGELIRYLRKGWVPDPTRVDGDLVELLNNL